MTGRSTRAHGRYAGRTATERHAERRQRLLDAALELFGAGPGYRSTSVAGLCETAGLSTRQFYQEFRTLEEVLSVLHLQVNEWSEAAVVEALTRTDGLPSTERYAAVFRAYAASVATDPRRIRITFTEIVGISTELDEQRLARRARWIDLMCAEAAAAVSRGEAADRDYRIAATAFIGSVNGLLHDWATGWVDASLGQVVDELVRMLLSMLRPAPEG